MINTAKNNSGIFLLTFYISLYYFLIIITLNTHYKINNPILPFQ